MLVCNVYHEGNKKFAQRQMDQIRDKCGKLAYPVLLVKNCVGSLDFSGVSDNVIELEVDLSNIKYPFVTSAAFNVVAKHAMDEHQSFIWLEPDVYINSPTFAEQLDKELVACQKRAVLSSSQHPPHDIITGIGAYQWDVHDAWRKAIDTPTHAWDLAAVWWFSHDFVRSDLIWHSYADYSSGKVEPYIMDTTKLGSAVLAHKVWDIGVFDK